MDLNRHGGVNRSVVTRILFSDGKLFPPGSTGLVSGFTSGVLLRRIVLFLVTYFVIGVRWD